MQHDQSICGHLHWEAGRGKKGGKEGGRVKMARLSPKASEVPAIQVNEVRKLMSEGSHDDYMLRPPHHIGCGNIALILSFDTH